MRARAIILQNPQIKVEHSLADGEDYTHFIMTISEVLEQKGRQLTINSQNEFTPGITTKGVTVKPEFLADCFRQVADMIEDKFEVTEEEKQKVQDDKVITTKENSTPN